MKKSMALYSHLGKELYRNRNKARTEGRRKKLAILEISSDFHLNERVYMKNRLNLQLLCPTCNHR